MNTFNAMRIRNTNVNRLPNKLLENYTQTFRMKRVTKGMGSLMKTIF